MSDQEIKQRIYEKALDCFLRFGFSKVTMNEIAEELGMSKKTLYQYFAGKEALLSAVVTRMHEDAATVIERIAENDAADFTERLNGALNALSDFQARMTPHFLADLAKHAPQVCKVSNDIKRNRIHTVMSNLVAEGIKKGVFRDDINEELVVLVYGGALQHLLQPETFNRLGLSVAQIHRVIGTVIMEGIIRPEARKEVLVPPTVDSAVRTGRPAYSARAHR